MNQVVIARPAGVTVLHPLLYSDLATGEVVNRIFDHLVLTDERQRYVAGRLVTGWESTPDGLVWDFFLRPGARWHDGRPVTADDAVFTLETILDPAAGSARRSGFPPGDGSIRFAARGPQVLRVTLSEPFAPLLSALAWRPMVARHVFGRAPAGDPAGEVPVGSGAFRFARRTGDSVVLAADPGYHLGRAPLDEVVWRQTADIEEAVAELRAGRADYVPGVPAGLADGLAAAPGVRLVRSADTSFTYLGFHLDAPPFDDPRVRHAVAHAIDREALVREVLGGHGTVADGPFAPGDPWRHPAVARYDHDPERARVLLAEAGRPVRFTIRTVSGDRVKEAAAARIAADLREVGVSAEVRAQPMAELLRDHVGPRRFEAILLALVPGTDPDFLYSFYHSKMMTPHGWNRFAYRDPVVDELLEASRSEIDVPARRALIGAALEKITADAPQVFLFHPEVVDAARDDIILPALPPRAANRFMYLHEWFRTPERSRPPR